MLHIPHHFRPAALLRDVRFLLAVALVAACATVLFCLAEKSGVMGMIGAAVKEGVEVMDARTLEALKGSIAKWEAIVAGTGVDHGQDNCPLCALFSDEEDANGDSCDGCPVRQVTGFSSCFFTPYEQWAHLNYAKYIRTPYASKEWTANTGDLRDAAQAELDFLRSLLPDADQPPNPPSQDVADLCGESGQS